MPIKILFPLITETANLSQPIPVEVAPRVFEVIDLDEDTNYQPINKKLQCYFGKFSILLLEDELKLQLHLKAHPSHIIQEEIQVIDRDEYELTQPIQLFIKDSTLSDPLRKLFGSIGKLGQYLVQFVGNFNYVNVDSEKLTLKVFDNGQANHRQADLFYSTYKKIEKEGLLRDIRKVYDTFSNISQTDMNFIDPEVLLAVSGFTQEELLDLYRDGDNNDDSSQDDEESESQEPQTEGQSEEDPGQHNDKLSFASQLDANYQQMNEQSGPRGIPKQNEIPIYQRFRGIDINIPRKQKLRLAEKMLRIGYSKEEIIRFFGGGAEEMEAEGNRLPDYRNPQSARYKEIHMLVAKKQHIRHNQLLRRYGLPPVPELPQYSGEIVIAEKRQRDRRIKELLLTLVREKKFTKLEQLKQEMERHGESVSFTELKGYVEELKKKNAERNQAEKAKVKENNEKVIKESNEKLSNDQ